MSVLLKLEMPEGAFSALRQDPEGLTRDLRLAAASKWYEMGIISQEKAAEIAGLSRAEFIFSLSKYGVSPFQYTIEEIREELDRV
jgi:predicted HTH domain antitoxin